MYDIGASIGAAGNAGVVFINDQFWVSAWQSNNIYVLSNTGAFVEIFQVAGLSGTRFMTTDGINVYCGAASISIYVVDPITKTLTSTISITTTSNATARFCANNSSPAGATSSLAGGLFISTDVILGETILVGVSQATSSNFLYGMDVNTFSNLSVNFSNFKLYPNPVKDSFVISYKDENMLNVSIHNLLGKQVMKTKISSSIEIVDVSNLSKGTYIVSINSDNVHESFKIIKE
ncbi:T9SS type A sorting domain-containing protein [Flavobacterium sediminilitoris]|uniref:T9SS type A sorting domain-containing protein n=1 Tax=Flavobacterium sediminilitoris TaxID=2024526 RepID=A0ABY4HHX8_9FLAO|nr:MULTISPECIES: T9SS type A sorting domain-containing protein [Flavobacterium]UOX32443.1 T9SS type A sorting domain-containing protein [Flavobacterium sediminilitoris]